MKKKFKIGLPVVFLKFETIVVGKIANYFKPTEEMYNSGRYDRLINYYSIQTNVSNIEDLIIRAEDLLLPKDKYDPAKKDFLKPDSMKKISGFDCIVNNDPYFEYANDGTKHRNKDYNSIYPEPKGKVIVHCNLSYAIDMPFIEVKQDGGTRKVYHGICPSVDFLELILNNIR